MREWTRQDIDKSGWGDGPWTDEPDKVQWVDEATGLDCLIVRQPRSGHLCGYVGVGPDHPCHGRGYSDAWEDDYREGSPDNVINVHGGLTFADACAESEDPAHGICHIAEPGRPEHVWWFGFDCAHAGDYSPRDAIYAAKYGEPFSRDGSEAYRDRAYVEAQVRSLAAQLAAILAPTDARALQPKAAVS